MYPIMSPHHYNYYYHYYYYYYYCYHPTSRGLGLKLFSLVHLRDSAQNNSISVPDPAGIPCSLGPCENEMRYRP